ncbi:MAG: NAD(P)-dependent glycerol-1-phosphate dehydrogenase [Candidatus Methanomethylophilaceae archaeon]|jgi:glycerol-1-phosphate dehydrogenase [NAD(P)+]
MTEFTKAKTMDFPRTVRIGHDTILESGQICDDLQFGRNGTIITGEKTYRAAGKTVEDLMTDRKYNIRVISTGNATPENVENAIAVCKEDKADYIAAVGGGSKIDIAKLVAADLKIPFLSIPTSVAHDGIASDRASLKLDKGSKSVPAVSPMGIIADSAVINKAPYRFLAAGCADVISNLNALNDWDFAVRMRNVDFSSSGYAISKFAAENLIENCQLIKPHFEESVWMTMRPIIASGVSMCIAGSSRPTSGSEHMFSHALDLLHPSGALHGEQCGLGTIMMMKLHGGNWERIRDALRTIGAPVTAKQLNIPDQHIIDALVAAKDIRKDRFTILGDWGLTEEAAENLARSTGVI